MMVSTSPRIMVIDDDPDTVQLLRMVLQRKGYKVTTASTWEDIVDRLRMNEETKEQIDLIILDIMMPGRSGFDVYLVLQVVLHPMPPVIFLSAKCGMDDMIKASELGAAKYLTKPTTPDKLISAVESVLSKVRR